MATKRDRMVTHLERLLTIKSFYTLITWSCKVTWQTKIIIYPQPECLWLQTWQNDKLLGWVPTYSHINFWSRGLAKIRWQTKTIISPLPVSMVDKLLSVVTYLDRFLIIKSYKALITWSCKVTWQTKTNVSITRVPMTTKLGRMMNSLDGLLPVYHITFWSRGLVRYEVHLLEE